MKRLIILAALFLGQAAFGLTSTPTSTPTMTPTAPTPVAQNVPQEPAIVNVAVAAGTAVMISLPSTVYACFIHAWLNPTDTTEVTVTDVAANVVLSAKSGPATFYFGTYGPCYKTPITFTGTGHAEISWYSRGSGSLLLGN